ncbi:Cro/CI family transcriptional regulator [Acinetobacter higginsii]|uniref:Cro/CI family transcriptional regulator n=1 Tax=Acinetobacter higginsii TaxID=70347 RepID=UPI001F4AB18B|nr:Cro/CI family transcriptional regulator [Acinetobacter higginsii]MCH7294120.1 Cro/CI family transcriptional regulator [Acinetobacter higginsii]
MTKQEALELLNCSVADLALKLEISSQAISQWSETKIPLMREYQVRDLAIGKTPIKRSTKNSSQIAI